MLWTDTPRLIWRDAKTLAELWGLTCVEVVYKSKVYTYSAIESPDGKVIWFGCVTKK